LEVYEQVCRLCGETFRTERKWTRYCSDRCRTESNRMHAHAWYLAHKKKRVYEYTCDMCKRRIRCSDRISNRKTCDECLSTLGWYGRVLMEQRKPVTEEVIK
jgi:hypothetical protein